MTVVHSDMHTHTHTHIWPILKLECWFKLGLVFVHLFGFSILRFWATVCSPYAIGPLSVCPVCNVGVVWPNSLTDQDETLHIGRSRPWPHCVTWGPSSPSPKGAHPPIFGPYPLYQSEWNFVWNIGSTVCFALLCQVQSDWDTLSSLICACFEIVGFYYLLFSSVLNVYVSSLKPCIC